MQLVDLHYATLLPLASIGLLVVALELDAIWGSGGRVLKAGLALNAAGWPVYLYAFVSADYTLAEVARTVSDGLELPFRVAASWSSGGSSLYFFSVLLSLALLAAMGRGEAPRGFRLVAETLMLTVLAAAALNGAFEATTGDVGGIGINPLLKSYWVLPHPVATFIGYSLILVASLSLLWGYRSWLALMMAGWASLTAGLALGGYWSYDTFGWGGYWAWDPVETAQLMVWLGAAATVHSIGPLSQLRRPMAALTASSVMLALYVTRSGLSPLHSFAAPDIGAAVLLAYSIPLAAIALYLAAKPGEEGLVSRIGSALAVREGLRQAATAAGGLAVAASFVYVYSSLLSPSVATALGFEVAAPTGAAGTRFYNPFLFAAAMVAALTLPAALAWAGEPAARVYRAFLASTVTGSAAAASLALLGVVEPSPASDPITNAMIASGLVAASSSLVFTAALAASSWRKPHLLAVRAVHLGALLTLVGVLASGSFAYNDSYMTETRLTPGDSVELGGVSVNLRGFDYAIGPPGVDLASYAANEPVGLAAWSALTAISEGLGSLAAEVLAAGDYSSWPPGYKAAAYLALEVRELEAALVSLKSEASVRVVGVEGRVAELEGAVRVELEGVKVSFELEPVEEGGELAGGVLVASTRASSLLVEPAPQGLPEGYSYLEVELAEPVKVRVGDVTLSFDSLRVYPAPGAEPRVEDGTLRAGFSALSLGGLTVDTPEGRVELPFRLPRGVYLYLEAAAGRAGVLSAIISSGLAEVLASGPDALGLDPRPGRLNLPERVIEWAAMRVVMEVDDRIVEARIRFEVNGEVTGVRGLVIDVVQVDRGLSDVYITVAPPVIEAGGLVYHELLVYYMSEAFRRLPEPQALNLLALLSAAYALPQVSGAPPEEAAEAIVESMATLYSLASSFTPESSAVYTEGLIIQVKVVPLVDLVWYGSALTTISMVAVAAMQASRLLKPRAHSST